MDSMKTLKILFSYMIFWAYYFAQTIQMYQVFWRRRKIAAVSGAIMIFESEKLKENTGPLQCTYVPVPVFVLESYKDFTANVTLEMTHI